MRQARIPTTLVLSLPKQRTSLSKKAKSPIQIRRNQTIRKVIFLSLVYLFLAVMAFVVLFPFYYMIAASFMTQTEASRGAFAPELSSMWENIAFNYSNTFRKLNFFSHVGTTLLVAIATTILQLLTTILASFALARLQFRGRDVVFILFLATMMVPGELLAISNYTTMSNLNFIGNDQTYLQAILVMILPMISSSFYIYLLRQNFKQIPDELYLAAKVDGKSDWDFLWKVMAPLASPTLVTIAILSFISSWNSYVWPSRSVSNSDFQVISVIIRTGSLTYEVSPGEWRTMIPWQMAASVLTVVPLLILFIVFRKTIMSGTGRSGIKG
ncbi:MAG: carbohydrate ABC transporter permease [Candidatus Enteromonas sp.]|nr:carbohydrate ABC transporter permease [Candidatus Enteromonas sp.]